MEQEQQVVDPGHDVNLTTEGADKAAGEQKSLEQEMKEFLSSEQNRQKALGLAEQIETMMGKNWFTLERLVRDSSESRESAAHKLHICKMFKLIDTRLGDWQDGRHIIRQPLFKVTISLEDKISALDRIVKYHYNQIDNAVLQQKQYQSQLAKQNKSQ